MESELNWDGLDALLKAKPLDNLSSVRDSEYFGNSRMSFYMSPPKEDPAKRLASKNKENQTHINKPQQLSFDIKDSQSSIPKVSKLKPTPTSTLENKAPKNTDSSIPDPKPKSLGNRFVKPPAVLKKPEDPIVVKDTMCEVPTTKPVKSAVQVSAVAASDTSVVDVIQELMRRVSVLEQAYNAVASSDTSRHTLEDRVALLETQLKKFMDYPTQS